MRIIEIMGLLLRALRLRWGLGRSRDEGDELEPIEFEQAEVALMVNRSAVVVRPRERCLEWAKRLGGPPPFAQQRDPKAVFDEDRTVLLIPFVTEEAEAREALTQLAQPIFEAALFEWSEDPEEWPERRDLTALQEWYEVKVVGIVRDIGEGGVLEAK